jgi:FixJ family two-component response regulator
MMEASPEIIVVDDDASMGQAIERQLTASGCRVRSFSSAEDLLGSDAVKSVAFLILDIHLPGMSGFELKHRLAADGICPPVIFITGHDRPQFRKMAEQLGAIAYLTKPFEGQFLISAIRQHFKTSSV